MSDMNLERFAKNDMSQANPQGVRKLGDESFRALTPIRSFLDDVETIIDVGVFRGTPTLYELFREKAFVLIDPLRNAEGLLTHRPNKYTFVNKALGSKPGRLTLRVQKSMTSLLERTPLTTREGPQDYYEVEVTTLDQTIDELRPARPFGMKIDTEGFELEVFAGLNKHIGDFRFIICEASIRKRFVNGYTFSDLVVAMKAKGFEFFNFLNRMEQQPKYYDVLFLPANHPLFD